MAPTELILNFSLTQEEGEAGKEVRLDIQVRRPLKPKPKSVRLSFDLETSVEFEKMNEDNLLWDARREKRPSWARRIWG